MDCGSWPTKTKEEKREYYRQYRQTHLEEMRAANRAYMARKRMGIKIKDRLEEIVPDVITDTVGEKHCSDCKHCKVSFYNDGCAYCSRNSGHDRQIAFYEKKHACVNFRSMED